MKTWVFKSVMVLVAAMSLTTCDKKKTGNVGSAPAAVISDVTQDRTKTSSVFRFSVSLTTATTNPVSIHYSTTAGTAIASTDFVAAIGTVTIPANQLQAFIDVTVTGDSLR